MKYYIIAGEASGDLHGSNLVTALHRLDAATQVRCWGGEKMQAAGATLVKHYRDLAFMGFVEVIANLRTIFRNLAACKQDILSYQPDALILIDYPGFNLRMAKWAKQQGFTVIYYISPQVWAWKENRVKGIKKFVDLMLVILPFEKEFYKKWAYEVEYVGHPLVQVVDEFKQRAGFSAPPPGASRLLPNIGSPLIALLPGSRKQEILAKLPIMLGVASLFPTYHFVVAKAPGVETGFYDALLAEYSNVTAVESSTYPLLAEAVAALVTSGTATLETALFQVPEVVCYKGNAISFRIAKMLVKIRFICLVNLIMDKEVVKELIQDELTVANLRVELDQILHNSARKQQLQHDYEELRQLLSKGGNASVNAARQVIALVNKQVSHAAV